MVILVIFAIIIILLKIFFSINIKLEIENLKIILPKEKEKISNKDSKILLKIYILNKIKIAEINLKKIDLKNDKFKNKLQKQFEGNKFNLDIIKFLRNINYIIEKLKFNVYIGTEDAAITAIGVGLGYMVISNFLKRRVIDSNNIQYKIYPIYQNKNIIKIQINSIIIIKIENIIDIIKFIKKGKVSKNVRTSHRSSYAYSNE